jgi:hypothetical protein
MASFFSSGSLVASNAATPATSAATDDARVSSTNAHYHFIHSMIVPSTVKIQKELRGRRFRVSENMLREESA